MSRAGVWRVAGAILFLVSTFSFADTNLTPEARLRSQVELQIKRAAQDVEAQRWENAIRRLEFVLRSKALGRDESAALDDVHYQLGVAYLGVFDVRRGRAHLAKVQDSASRQAADIVLANYLLENGYYPEALRAYLAAGQNPVDKEAARQSAAVAQDLQSFKFDLKGSVQFYYDGNPLGLPPGSGSENGAANPYRGVMLSTSGQLRGPLSAGEDFWHYFWYGFSLDLAQLRSFEQGAQSQLDSRSATLGAFLSTASSEVGSVFLRYDFTYAASPLTQGVSDSYPYSTGLRVHQLWLEAKKDLGRVVVGVDSKTSYSQYPILINSTYNWPGVLWSESVFLGFKSSMPWLNPTLKVGYDQNLSPDSEFAWHAYSWTVSNQISIEKLGAEVEVWGTFQYRVFPQFDPLREEGVNFAGVTSRVNLRPHLSFVAQGNFTMMKSNYFVYTQNRSIVSSGLEFSL